MLDMLATYEYYYVVRFTGTRFSSVLKIRCGLQNGWGFGNFVLAADENACIYTGNPLVWGILEIGQYRWAQPTNW